jgi:hypothetical protein
MHQSTTDVIQCIRPSIPTEQEYECDFGDEIDEDSYTENKNDGGIDKPYTTCKVRILKSSGGEPTEK